MKKILSFIVALTMICTVFAGISVYAADDMTIAVSNVTAKAGETVAVDVTLSNNPGITALYFKVGYADGLTISAKPTATNIFGGGAITLGGNIALNPYGYTWSEDMNDFDANGIVMTIQFKVSEDAVPGDYAITLVPDQVYNANIDDIDVNWVNGKITVEPDGPVVPTAEDLGLFTDDQVLKVAENVMTNNGYSINKALAFVSGIYADAAVVTYGTEITCDGYAKVLDIPAVNTYEAATNVKGFVAAVTSIRNDNLNKAFSAKAYADVTVGEETVRVYAEDVATAIYAN
jgi:hypothetical protein